MSISKHYEFKGTPCFGIFKDEDAERPIIAFGIKKAKAIVEHLDDIRDFVIANSQPEETDD